MCSPMLFRTRQRRRLPRLPLPQPLGLNWLGLAWLGLVAIVQVLDQRLASVDRSTPIMMYCTGGIRCVKARSIAQ